MMTPSSEQYAQLAALFTTSDDVASTPSIELLLPAHLPVQGGLWLIPYAGREAINGVSILVRMQQDVVDIAAVGQGSFDLDGCQSIEDVLEHVDVPVSSWIVQPPSDADPTSLLHCDADCVTLLSGADQAAVVGAYRLLKGLISASGSSDALPTIRLVIVGTEERAANDAASRIVQTAHHQLNVKVKVGHPLPAMGSSNNVISQVSFPRASNVVDLMARIRSAMVETEELQEAHQEEPIQEHEVVAPTVDETTMKECESVVPAQEPFVTYASHIQGLLSILPRCPEHEQVELAIDSGGCVHVLSDAREFRDCSIVSAWSIRHSELISLACGGVQIDTKTPPVQHLFTSDAVSVADLHGSGVQLHLLAEVHVQGKTGMFCTPLN